MLARRVPRLAVLLAFACLSSGCLVTNLQPIYDPGSLEADDSLVGTWQGQDQGATVVVERGEWKSYQLTYTSRSTSYVLVGYLTRIGDALFLDLTPAHGVEAGPLMVPVHGICRLQHEGDTVTVAVLDYDWFTSALKAKKLVGLDAAVDSRQNLLLTSTTEAVRAWLSKNLKTADAFREPITFTRAK
jgi:hypothetical protein